VIAKGAPNDCKPPPPEQIRAVPSTFSTTYRSRRLRRHRDVNTNVNTRDFAYPQLMRCGSVRKIPIWENRRRLRMLHAFRKDVLKYFEQAGYDQTFGNCVDTEESEITRSAINRSLDDIDAIIDLTGLGTTITWTPAPAVGGFVQQIPVVTNVFNLHHYQVPHQTLIDFVDRAIGIYKRDQTSAWIRTFNPFFWFGLALDYVASLPFRIARRAGFNPTKIEDSWFGRLVKFVVMILGAVGSLVAILQAVGLLEVALKSVGIQPPNP
jgi:hypothetical protein